MNNLKLILEAMEENTKEFQTRENEPYQQGYYDGQMNLIKHLLLRLQN